MSAVVQPDGPFCYLGKYENHVVKSCEGDPFKLPKNFKHADAMIVAGDPPLNEETVIGRVWNYVRRHGPISGRDLVERLMEEDWRGHPSAYASSGKVCSLWVTGYVDGMLRPRNGYLRIQE